MTANVYARGITRDIVLATETTFGVQAAGPGQLLRRTNFTMDNQPPDIPSTEITVDAQHLDTRLGVRSLAVNLSGQLSPGTYKALFAALLRGTWTAGVAASAITDSALTINSTTGVISFTSTLTNFLTVGFKKGDVCRISGLTGGLVGLNGVNLHATNVAAGAVTFSPNTAAVAYASGQSSVALTVVGKKVFMPAQSSQVYTSFSIESWNPGIGESQLGLGIRPTQIALAVQPNGFTTMQATMLGQTDAFSTSQVYTTPTAQSTASGVTGVNGVVSYAGNQVAYITGFNVQMAAAAQPVPGIGSTVTQDIFMGMLTIRGSITALLTTDTFSSDFISENDVDLSLYLPSSPAPGADFISLYMGRVRLQSNNRQDSDRAIMRSLNFTTLQQVNGGTGTAWDDTSLVMQDSLA